MKRSKVLFSSVFSLALFLGAVIQTVISQTVYAATYQSTVASVTDGDTITLSTPVQGATKVRLLSIDTPETNYNGENQGSHATNASNYLKQLLPVGTQITLETDSEEKDTYGRLLAHVFKGRQDVNKEMLLKGHAVSYYIWPNMKYFTEYQAAVVQARQAGLGIWNPDDPLQELPFEFRDRVSGNTQDKYVGNYDTKMYVDPAQYKNVPIEKRVFFFTEQDAITAGYKKENANPQPSPTTGLYINELLPAPQSKYTSEWIEIYNATDATVDLSGYKIDDIQSGGQSPYTIPAGTVIPAKGYYVWNTNSYFNNSSDSAFLIAPNGSVVDSFSYSSIKYDQFWYRSPDGGSWSSTMDPTPTKQASNQ